MNKFIFWIKTHPLHGIAIAIWVVVIIIGAIVFRIIHQKTVSAAVMGVNIEASPTDTPIDFSQDVATPTDAPVVSADTPIDTPIASDIPIDTPVPTPTPAPYIANIVSISPSGSVTADGSSNFSITINVTDKSGEPQTGQNISLSGNPGGASFSSPNSVTDSGGNVIFYATSTTQNTYVISVLINGQSITVNGGNSITFTSAPAATDTPTPTPTDTPSPTPTPA